ncbi:MAG TPA: hypothetical protein VII72_03190 [Myxococcota bacterium]|jgi:hypothetical protein
MTIDPIERTNLALGAGAFAACWWLATPAFALSLGFGALLEAVNFRGLRRSAQFLFWGQIQSGRAWSGVFALRFGLLVIGIGSALAFGADPVGLLVGLSLIMPAAIFEAWRARPPIDPSAPALAPDDPSWDNWNPWLAREQEPADED